MQFKLTSSFRFWSTFGPVQNPFKDRSYFRPPSQMVFLGVCRSALFFVCPSGCLSQSEADCGLWQVAPSPPLTSFKPSYRLPLPSQQNIPALYTKSCCFFKYFSNFSAQSTEYSRPLYPPKSVAFSNISSFCTDLSTSTFFSFFAWPKSRQMAHFWRIPCLHSHVSV